jgi:fucose 4-O-acetylase-like acetyltransferase
MSEGKVREIWADNAKFIGISLMLLGHVALTDKSVIDFIYAFHMPLFFLLSGYFASDKQSAFVPYLAKNVKGLLVPYLFFAILSLPNMYYYLWNNRAVYTFDSWGEFVCKPLLGLLTVSTTEHSYFIGPIWFFVALFNVRIFFYFCKLSKCSFVSLLVTASLAIGAYLFISKQGWYMPFRLVPALLAYPFYVFGYVLHRYLPVHSIAKRMSHVELLFMVVFLYIAVCVIVVFNGHVEMAGGGFGNHLCLLYLGGVVGSTATILLSCTAKENIHILTI